MKRGGGKAALPRWNDRKGWHGGNSRTLYAFTDKRTGRTLVRPVYSAGGIGDYCTVRVATRREAERPDPEGWQNPLHSGWLVRD